MPTGTYTLLVELTADATVEVGALGDRTLQAGWYAYTGSAFGPGGLARVDRHREVAAGERSVCHWHVDYLLGHGGTSLVTAVTSPGVDAECGVARDVDGDAVAGFGASDCGCDSHLAYAPERDSLERSVRAAHERRR